MSFLIKDGKLLEKYKKVSNSVKRGFDSEPMCNEKYLKKKLKSYGWTINTKFHSDKIPKEGS